VQQLIIGRDLLKAHAADIAKDHKK
jgi:hypothetical protein